MVLMLGRAASIGWLASPLPNKRHTITNPFHQPPNKNQKKKKKTPQSGSDNHPSFSAGALFLFFVPYIAMAIVSYGTAVPSGERAFIS